MTKDSHLIEVSFNGRIKQIEKRVYSYNELISLAFENPPSGEKVQFTIQFSRGEGKAPSGTVAPGKTLKLKNGMEFDVTPTNRS